VALEEMAVWEEQVPSGGQSQSSTSASKDIEHLNQGTGLLFQHQFDQATVLHAMIRTAALQ